MITSEPNFIGEEIPLETLDSAESSERETEYDDVSYGSDVKPPVLLKGLCRCIEIAADQSTVFEVWLDLLEDVILGVSW